MANSKFTCTVLSSTDYAFLRFKATQSLGYTTEGFTLYSNVLTALNGISPTKPTVSFRDAFDMSANGVYQFMMTVPVYERLLSLIDETDYVLLVFDSSTKQLLDEIKLSVPADIKRIDNYVYDDDMDDWKQMKMEVKLAGRYRTPRKRKYAKTNTTVCGCIAHSAGDSLQCTRSLSQRFFYKRTSLVVYKRMRQW